MDGIGTGYATMKVVDPEGSYKSVGLDCEGEMLRGGGPQYAPGTEGKKGDVVEMVQHGLADELRGSDKVELAGYPKARDS